MKLQNAIALVLICILCTLSAHSQNEAKPVNSETKNALPKIFHQFEIPQWFSDVKYGIWLHWGPQSIPVKGGGWYARHMYVSPDSIGREKWGADAWQFHRNTYGHQSEFGYKDLCNSWKTDQFDAEKMVSLFEHWGAKYVAMMANHHDNFDLFRSTIHQWNSFQVGPHRDLVGEFSDAARKHQLKWAATVHSARAKKWFLPAFGADAAGPDKNIPYDGNQTLADGNGKWWEGMNPQQLYASKYDNFEQELAIRHLELVKNYRPDLLYFDDQEIPQPMIAACTELYQNSLLQQGKIETIVSVKHPQKGTLLDYEKGVPGEILDMPFQTETTLAEDWFLKPDSLGNSVLRHDVRSLKELLADVISKRGTLLVNVAVRGDGSIPEDQFNMMESFGVWIKTNNEAIYNTIPWITHGYGGITEAGHFKERGINSIPWDSTVTRFTQSKDGKIIYLFVFGQFQNRTLHITEFANKHQFQYNIKKISLLGQKNKIYWKLKHDGLKIKFNHSLEDKHCNVFKIEI